MLENESTVDAGQEMNVESQIDEVSEPIESESSEVATDAVEEKPVQSPETNHEFAEVRRKAAQEAQDKLIADMYGESHGIYTKADYDKAIKEQKEAELLEQMKQDEVDPKEIYSKLKESDPDFQEFQKIKTETYTQNQLNQLNQDLKELDIDVAIKSLDDIAKLENASDIIKQIEQGKTLSEAYFLANRKQIIQKEAEKVRNETIKKTEMLSNSSPGALDSSGGDDKPHSFATMSSEEFAKYKDDVLMGRRK